MRTERKTAAAKRKKKLIHHGGGGGVCSVYVEVLRMRARKSM